MVKECGRRDAECGILKHEAEGFFDILVLASGHPGSREDFFLDRIN